MKKVVFNIFSTVWPDEVAPTCNPALLKLRQDDCQQCKTSPGYIVSACLKKPKNNKTELLLLDFRILKPKGLRPIHLGTSGKVKF